LSPNTRLALLTALAFAAGATATVVVVFQLRFLWVAYQHGGFM
jgi:hypothetical protein